VQVFSLFFFVDDLEVMTTCEQPQPRRLLDHEIARIVGKRSKDLARGSPARVEIDTETDSWQIARIEFAQGKCPLLIKDPVSGLLCDVNQFVTPYVIEFLRLNFLNDWEEKKAEVAL
jgi:DNA-directed RNA polymerase subunit K/omega